jgi:hypothetical protein
MRTHRSVIFHSSALRWKNWLIARRAACRKILFPSAGDAMPGEQEERAHSLQGNIKYSPLVILVCGIGRGANFLIEQRLREDVIILETSDFVCPAARALAHRIALFLFCGRRTSTALITLYFNKTQPILQCRIAQF